MFSPNNSHYASGADNLRQDIRTAISDILRAPRFLSGSEWSNSFAVLSAGVSSDPGPFECLGFQVGLLDAMTDPGVAKVTVIKSAQVGFTRLLCNIAGYYIHQDPSPVLMIQPRESDAKSFSNDEITPMLRDTPVLRAITDDPNATKAENRQTALKKVFRNGSSLAFVGAKSPDSFRRIKARIVLFDEIDGYDASAGVEGDPITLGTMRSLSFWNRKIIHGSTPVLKGDSRIEKLWEESDKRRYFLKCPHCGHEQYLKFENLEWNKTFDEDGNVLAHHPETAYFKCANEEKSCVIEEHHKPAMVKNGRWIAEKPFEGHAGFHIWAAYSIFENASWGNIAKEYLRAKRDPALMQTFYNLTRGEPYEQSGERVDPDNISKRAEAFNLETIPDRVVMLTAGVDIQQDRLECVVVGWAAQEESFVLGMETIVGSPAEKDVWDNLDIYLRRTFEKESGGKIRIKATGIDRNGGFAEEADKFCKERSRRNVFSCFGSTSASSPIWPKHATVSKYNARIWHIGVSQAKETIYGRLRIPTPVDEFKNPTFDRPIAKYIHFSDDLPDEFFKQVTAEQVVIERDKNGRSKRVWKKLRERNEALDTICYALAAYTATGKNLDRLAIEEPAVEVVDGDPVEASDAPSTAPSLPDVAAPLPRVVEPRRYQQPPPPRRRSIWAK